MRTMKSPTYIAAQELRNVLSNMRAQGKLPATALFQVMSWKRDNQIQIAALTDGLSKQKKAALKKTLEGVALPYRKSIPGVGVYVYINDRATTSPVRQWGYR